MRAGFPNEETMRERGLVQVDAVYRDRCWCCSVSDNGIGSTGSFDGCGGRVLEDLAGSIAERDLVIEESPPEGGPASEARRRLQVGFWGPSNKHYARVPAMVSVA